MSLLVGLLALALVVIEPGECHDMLITYYSAEDYPGLTADSSTTTWGSLHRGEPIVAAGPDLPFDAYVWIEGRDVYRVADRGGQVGLRRIDILVATTAEATARGVETRRVCRIA